MRSEVRGAISEGTVHELLAHLRDGVYLQQHPLAQLLVAAPGKRGEALRELLLGLLERLKPEPGTPLGDPAWRPYQSLHLRYVEQLPPWRVQEVMALSERQVRREQSRGVAALAQLLTEVLAELGPAQLAGPAQLWHEAARSFETALQPLDVQPLLQEVIQTAQPRLRACGVTLELRVPSELTLYADRVTARQVLLHVLSAVAERASGQLIGLSAAKEGGSVVLRFQAPCIEPPLTAEALAECNVLAELSLGSVWQEREQGWVISCSYPAKRPFTCLLIDDEEAAERLLQRMLHGSNIRVVAVRRSEEAVAVAERLRPDVIMLDVLMPRRDGWEVLQALRSHPVLGSTPVVVCSVWKDPELALALGASAFIRKPLTRPQVLAVLERVLPTRNEG